MDFSRIQTFTSLPSLSSLSQSYWSLSLPIDLLVPSNFNNGPHSNSTEYSSLFFAFLRKKSYRPSNVDRYCLIAIKIDWIVNWIPNPLWSHNLDLARSKTFDFYKFFLLWYQLKVNRSCYEPKSYSFKISLLEYEKKVTTTTQIDNDLYGKPP